MVEVKKRARLREALTQLVEGLITNDQFSDLWQECECSDPGVRMIGELFMEFCTDDRSYRLAGCDALNAGGRAFADRCLLFLQTDREYEWPEAPSVAIPAAAGGAAIFLVLPLGVVLLIAALVFAEMLLAVGGIACLGLSGLCYWWWSHREDMPEWRAYWASGEREAWPFLRCQDREQAIRDLAQPGGAP